MKITIKILKSIAFIIIIGGVVYWLKFAPVPVEKYQVKRGEIINEAMGTGTLDAKIKMIISSKISGRIENVMVDQGDKVSANQLVATLDDKTLALQAAVAKATLTTVKSAVDKLRKDLEYSKAVLSNAEKTYKRYKKLLVNHTISQEEFDKADEELKIARSRNRRAEAAVVESENKVVEAKKTLELRKSQFEDSQLRAPFDGIITERKRDPGNIVVPGSEILSLISTNVLWIRAWVGETELEKLKKGQPAKIIFRSEPKNICHGKVARIAIEVDKETREFIADVYVNELPANWAIGQRAEVYIETKRKENVLIIPEKYIKWQKNNPGVFIDKNGKAKWVHVKTGLNGNDLIEITAGLKEGDKALIPVNLKDKLKNHSRITVK